MFERLRLFLIEKWQKFRSDTHRRCPQCGAEVSASARTCFMCGADLSVRRRKVAAARPKQVVRAHGAELTCPHCGAPISRTAKICSICEKPVGRKKARIADEAPSLPVTEQTAPVGRRRARRQCPTCGARIGERADVCPMCGQDLKRAILEADLPLEPEAEAQEGETVAPVEPQERLIAQIIEQEGESVCSCCGAVVLPDAGQCTICGATFDRQERECPPPPVRIRLLKPWYRKVWVWTAVVAILAVAVVGRVYLPRWTALLAPSDDLTATPTRKVIAAKGGPTVTATPVATPTRRPTATPAPSPTPTVTATPTPTPTPTPVIHVVQPGQTLYGIARLYGVTVAELSQANGLSTMSYLRPGDQLIIPVGPESTPVVPGLTIHTVLAGEKLSDLARRYGISEARIREANGMGENDQIKAGDRLIIPAEPTPTPTATVTPTPSATPGPAYPAPNLIYPPQDARFAGPEQVILLQWTSVGVLQADEWYAVYLRYLGQRAGTQPVEATMYTRATSWRVPAEWYPDAGATERRFQWHVSVVRSRDGQSIQELLSPQSEIRRFEWH